MSAFESRRVTLIDYLLDKVYESDWHGVSDAANDLRVLEAEMKVKGVEPGGGDVSSEI